MRNAQILVKQMIACDSKGILHAVRVITRIRPNVVLPEGTEQVWTEEGLYEFLAQRGLMPEVIGVNKAVGFALSGLAIGITWLTRPTTRFSDYGRRLKMFYGTSGEGVVPSREQLVAHDLIEADDQTGYGMLLQQKVEAIDTSCYRILPAAPEAQ